MADFVADLRDIKFVLFEQLQIERLLKSSRYGQFGRQDIEMILDEAYKFAKDELWPINAAVDRKGCSFDKGRVRVPEELRGPWKGFVESGWISLDSSPEYGGQGAPESVAVAVNELFFGACLSFNLGVMLTSGAAHLIETWGTDALKSRYVQNMLSGKWTGTMCLTESQAGSDVGASKTKARREGDHYLIEGEKIFITCGEHDLSENIIHAVLARIEGAPSGTKGLSLFVVPKIRVNADGSLGEPNDVACTGIEHKLGIHGSPTCTMLFGGEGKCHGWLLGEEHQGMRAMFQMMNEARISVGLQGAAIANAAYQGAVAYCRERLQGSDINRFRDPDAPKVPILKHPDVRMSLLRQKAYAEGLRALLTFTACCADRERTAEDEPTKARHRGLLELLTPICKAYASDMGFRVAEWALQCHGGYGYTQEYAAEQFLRDAKIASIYEGTNGIQALDLVGRKLTMEGGAPLMYVVGMINALIEENAAHPTLADVFAALAKARDTWGEVNGFFMGSVASKKLIVPILNASTYLSLCGDLMLGYFLADQAVLATRRLAPLCAKAGVDPADGKAVAALAKTDAEVRFFDAKIKTARFFCAQELPAVQAKAVAIQSGDLSALQVLWEDEG